MRAIVTSAAGSTDITPVLGETRWSTGMEEVSARVDFLVPYHSQYIPRAPVDVGYLAALYGASGELFRGFVTGALQSGQEDISYTVRDPGFYLVKSDGIYKFAGVRADDAVRRICADFGVPVGAIAAMPTLIKQKYIGDKLADIIKDILDKHRKETGQKTLVRVRKGLLYVEAVPTVEITGTVRLAQNLGEMDWVGTIESDITRNRSLDETSTIIKVVVDEAVKAEALDAALIAQYGKLQTVIRMDSKDGGQAAKIAQEALKEKGRLTDKITLSALSVEAFVAGELVKLVEPITGASGKYRILTAEHKYTSAADTMRLELEVEP